MKVPHEESFYIEALLENNTFVVNRLYKEFFPKIRRMVTTNSGNADDAWDVFQNALVTIYKKAQSPDFVLTSPFYYFLYKVCWHIWMRELDRRKKRPKVTIDDENRFIDEVNIEDVIHQTERHALYKEKFAQLSEKCQQIIQLVLQKTKMREIAQTMNYNSADTAKQQHYKCKQRLIKFIREDNKFHDLKDA